jgi:hypothetical protein
VPVIVFPLPSVPRTTSATGRYGADVEIYSTKVPTYGRDHDGSPPETPTTFFPSMIFVLVRLRGAVGVTLVSNEETVSPDEALV